MLRARARTFTVLFITAIGAVLMPASALGARQPAGGPAAPKPFLDVRDAQRRAVERRGDVSLVPPSAGARSARARLRSRGAVVDVDALNGTPRLLAGRTAPLSAATRGDRREAAERFLRD